MMYGPSDVPFRVGTSSIGPHGASGKGKGGKGGGKGKVNVSSYYSEGKGGKCDDWMRTLWNQEFTRVASAMADSIGQVMKVAYFKGHDDGVADEREGLTEGKGKKGSFFGPPAEGSFFWTPAPGESSSSGSQKSRHANSPAEGDESGRQALRRRDWRDGDGERDEENDGHESRPGVQSDKGSLGSEDRWEFDAEQD